MFDLHTISFLLIFIAAGLVKGVTGMGLPTVAMKPTPWPADAARSAAAALLVLPSLLTNLWQLLRRPGAGADCTPSLAYDDRDYYWHVGRILTC